LYLCFQFLLGWSVQRNDQRINPLIASVPILFFQERAFKQREDKVFFTRCVISEAVSLSDITKRQAELEQEFQTLLEKAAGDFRNESYTDHFRTLAEEMADLKEKRKKLDVQRAGNETDLRIKQAIEIMENSSSKITEWEESTIRQLIDSVKIISNEEILVCLHGGIELRQKMG